MSSEKTVRVPNMVEVRHPGGELYGSDRVMLELVTEWSQAGISTEITLGEHGPMESELTRRGLEHRVLPIPVLRGEILKPRKFLRFLRASLGDLVRGRCERLRGAGPARYISTLTMPSQVLAARIAGRHTVLHVHEAEISRPKAVRAALSVSALMANSVIANSEFSRSVLLDSWPHIHRKIHVVHNPISRPFPMPETLPRERPNELQLVYVGRLSDRKGVDLAVLATIELIRRGIPVRLRIVGSVFRGNEGYEAKLRELVSENGMSDRIHFTGFVADVSPFISDSHVVMVPSRREESYGNVAAEAVLAGRFVAVADHSGLHEVVDELSSALKVREMTSVAWADALESLWNEWGGLRACIEADQHILSRRHDPTTVAGEAAHYLSRP